MHKHYAEKQASTALNWIWKSNKNAMWRGCIRGKLESYGDLFAEVNINFPKNYNLLQLKEIKRIYDAGEDLI